MKSNIKFDIKTIITAVGIIVLAASFLFPSSFIATICIAYAVIVAIYYFIVIKLKRK